MSNIPIPQDLLFPLDAPESEVADLAAFCAGPVIRATAPVKIALLRGPVYSDDVTWRDLIRYRNDIQRFFAEVGIRLIIDEHDGYAYADQAPEGEPGSDWPRLFHRDYYTYDVTCVLFTLREWLLTRESIPSDERRPLLDEDLVEKLRYFSRKKNSPAKAEDKRWREAIGKVRDYGFIKPLRSGDKDAWIVRPIIRAKIPIDTLNKLGETLEAEVAKRTPTIPSEVSESSPGEK